MSTPPDQDFVFNIVWTRGVFAYLRYLVASQIDRSAARFRFVVNRCPPAEVEAMEAFAARHPERVVEVLDVTRPGLMGHGDALDAVLDRSHDGEYFAFVDPDILARGPFLADFARRLAEGFDVVTSGRGVWCETDVVPDGHPGVNGEYFYSPEGYVFGSPHFAIYRRDALDGVRERWGIRLGMGGPEFPEGVRERLLEAGITYWLFDTAKVTNVLLQEDGHRLSHFEHPNLLHIGGVSHYLSAPRVETEDGGSEPNWARWDGMTSRFEVARFTAEALRALADRQHPPEVPAALDGPVAGRLADVVDDLAAVVDAYREW